VISDATWKATANIPIGFELPSTSDASWAGASSSGVYGIAPWNTDVSISDPLGEHPAPLLRKSFTLSKSISSARLYYSAGGYAAVRLNGAPASDHVLSPGFTKYDTQTQYVGLDVSALLVIGENVISAELGRAHYGVGFSPSVVSRPAVDVSQLTQGTVYNWAGVTWHGEPALRSILSITFSDGTQSRIVSDSSWKVIEGPTRLDDRTLLLHLLTMSILTFNPVFGGENFDGLLSYCSFIPRPDF
jgi:hypothetical protein